MTGHGIPVKPEHLDFIVSYLATLHQQIKQAIKNGLTLEQAQKNIHMEEFQGYTLWNWVHSGVNIPNTFKELSD